MENERGLIEIILSIKKMIKEKKIHFILSGMFGGILGLFYFYYLSVPTFTSNITFTLEQKNSSVSSLGGLASSLGLGDLPTTTSTGMFGGENILHLLKSNRIIHQSLKESQTELKGDNLLNEYIKVHFSKRIKSKKIKYYPKKILDKKFNRKQDSLLILITKNIRENQIKAERVDKKTTIINLEINDNNEKWAYLFSKALVRNAIDLYLEIKIGKILRTEQDLTQKRDSIRQLLNGSITSLAYESDMNAHIPLMRYKTNQAKRQVDVEVMKNMYASVLQNLEMTKFQRSQESPIIELIDEPILPLEKKEHKLYFVLAFGIFFSELILLVYFLIQDNLKLLTR